MEQRRIPLGFLYVLRCEGNRFYIGSTQKSVEERFAEHIQHYQQSRANKKLSAPGAQLTLKYEPLEIVAVFCQYHPQDEDRLVLEYMGTK
jgi:predicted GIY-YIG superfamily endonuclease